MIRLYVTCDLFSSAPITFTDNQVHYLLHVMRISKDENIAVFNGKDGEWSAKIQDIGKHNVRATCQSQLRAQEPEQNAVLYFSPIKKEAMAFLVQKATELGVSKFCPVIMQRTVAPLPKADKMFLQAVEAAEQSERLSVPTICPPISFQELFSNWPAECPLTYFNERGTTDSFSQAHIGDSLLIGPEGGFAPQELEKLSSLPFAHSLNLGKRILRAETAALVALTLWNQAHQWKK